jgi:uncharacterized membrane protein YcaP (DUF421 family)
MNADDLNAIETVARTLAVYAFALAVVRLGSKRFLRQASAFDVVVAITLGSILGRGMDGSGPLVTTLLCSAALIAVHWMLAALAYRIDWLGPLVKGHPTLLAQDGRIDRKAMREAGVSEHDLEQALRLQARRTDLAQIRLAYLERDGSISVIPAEREPVVLDIQVEGGIQTVRVRLE